MVATTTSAKSPVIVGVATTPTASVMIASTTAIVATTIASSVAITLLRCNSYSYIFSVVSQLNHDTVLQIIFE